MLRKNFFTAEEIERIVADFTTAGLPEEEVAVMRLARKVVTNAHALQAEDFADVRAHGLDDDEIFDVVLTAAARSFFAQTLDACGVQPDHAYLDTIHDLVGSLSVGRPFDSGEGG